MAKKVKKGMTAKQIATLHYELLMDNDKDEWVKTIRKHLREQFLSGRYGSSPMYWWNTGRKYVDKLGYSYKYKNKDERQSSAKHIKFFFHRLNKEGKPQGSGQVPIHVVKDEDDDDEWRVDVSSW